MSLIPIIWVILVFSVKLIGHFNPETFVAESLGYILLGNWPIIILMVLITAIGCFTCLIVQRHILYDVISEKWNNKFDSCIANSLLLGINQRSYLLFESHLIFRNKRIRNLFITPIYFILLTYLIFILKPIDDFYILFFWYLCLSGSWGYSYLQRVFSAESSLFDFISTSNFDFDKYIKSKYTIILIFSLLIILSALPIAFLRSQNIHILTSALLYNISIGYFIVFATGTSNKGRMDLNRGMLFNYQGDNPIQMISISASILIPLLFVGIMTLFISQTISLILINIISILSLFNYKLWFKFINRQFLIRKYKNLEAYRK